MTAIRIVIEIAPDFEPVDGDAFDAVLAALGHFEMPGRSGESSVAVSAAGALGAFRILT